MTNSLGQVTLNSSPIFTTTTGVPVSVANTSATQKLVIQALPTVLPTGSKAGEKITIITIPANQLATLMQANPPGQVPQLIQTKTVAAQLSQAAAVQVATGRPAPQLILAKPPPVVASSLPHLSVQVSQTHHALHKGPGQPLKPPSSRPTTAHAECAAVAVLPSNPTAASVETSAS